MSTPRENIELLPAELLWAEGNHASDVVLTALADGQHAIVPHAVRQHVEHCTACMAQLGHAALLSLHTNEQVVVARGRRPLPRFAIAIGLVAAALGVLPALVEAPLTHTISGAVRGLVTLSARLDAGGGTTAGLVVTYVTAASLVALGLAFVRFAPKKEVSR